MFRLESYITPILLDYVAKYVKNIREEDAQVSLWEGEATFHNLDMRLDVLEEEFNLPIELVSGHIHELTIQVPWHRLMSEPTRIIINTIEFVAKLRDDNGSSHSSPSRGSKQKKSRDSATETPQSTVSGMVSKIINNIAVTCHNIILKYVEEDIVVSMNVQLLNFGSASDEWTTAMVDVHPVNVVLRKLLQVSDLTICLDKRNAAGRIDVCQEPLLYRCTLECRLLHKYNVNNPSASTLRLGIFTKSMDINVSSLQFPMVMRLIKLLLALKSTESNVDPEAEGSDTDINDDLGRRSGHSQSAQQEKSSYFGWAWKLLPSFDNPPDPVDETEGLTGHILDIGIYAEELHFQLKNSEYIVDPTIGGMKRIRYTPIMRISLGGIYYERSSLKESDWGNVKAGLGSICVEPLGSYRTEDQREKTLVNTPPNKTRAFIDKSLFDKHYSFAEKTWATTNYEDYTSRITDEYMLYRSPVLAFDVIEYRAPPNNKQNETMAAMKHDLALRVQYRLLSAGITFHYSQSFLQVKNVISDFLSSYDYPAYTYAENLATGSSQATTTNTSMDDVDYSSLYNIRNCNYKFELRNFVVQFHAKNMPDSPNSSVFRPSAAILQSLPFMEIKIALAEGTLCTPQYATRIVTHAIQLADKPREILDACYDKYSFNVKNVSISLLHSIGEEQTVRLLSIPKLQILYKRLLMPSLWDPDDAALDTMEVNSDLVILEFSKRELFIAINLCNLIFQYDYYQLCALEKLVKVPPHKTHDVVKLQTHLTKMRICSHRYSQCFNFLISTRSINSEVCHTAMQIRSLVLSTTKGAHSKFFEIQMQIPYAALDYDKIERDSNADPNNSKLAIVCALWIEPFRLTVDMFLLQFLYYQDIRDKAVVSDNIFESTIEPSGTFLNQNMSATTVDSGDIVNNKRTSRGIRRISQPEETIHFSSDRDSKIDFERSGIEATSRNIGAAKTFTNHIKFFKALVVSIEIAESKIQVAETMTRHTHGEISNEYILIMLPKINVRSMHGENVVRSNVRNKMMVPIDATSCSWTIELHDLGLKYRYLDLSEQIVYPIRTTIIIALSHKSVGRKKTKTEKKAVESRSVEHIDTNQQLKAELSEEPIVSDKDVSTGLHKKVDWVQEEKEKEAGASSQKSILSVNLHIDTSQIILYGRKLRALHENYLILRRAIELLHPIGYTKKVSHTPHRNQIQVLTATEECPVAKDFLDIDSISLVDSVSSLQENIELIVFCQWTIPRIKVELENMVHSNMHKIVLVCEDLLLNVDKHSDFTKYTSKIENVFVNYYEANTPDEWALNECLRVRMAGEGTNLPLMSVVITTVNLSNLHSKIGVKAQNSPDRTLSEILISVLPIEVILDLNKVTEFILPLCELIELISTPEKQPVEEVSCTASSQYVVTPVCDLPMVHLDIKGITLYIPTDNGKKDCTVLVCKVTGIKVTPTLDNPLQRTPIRPDLYNKGAELGMLSTPGAVIEDRQYELSMQNISIATANWSQTLEVLRELQKRDQQNPAVEWNNQTPRPELKLTYIFNKFTFIAIYAPAMTFHNVLVCGQSIEYNCATDFVATLSTHQISLISCIVERLQRFSSIAVRACVLAKNSKKTHCRLSTISITKSIETIPSYNSLFRTSVATASVNSLLHPRDQKKKDDLSENLVKVGDSRFPRDKVGSVLSDSGVQSWWEAIHKEKHEPSIKSSPADFKRNIPHTVSFVAGVFIVKLFDAEEVDDDVVLKPIILLTVSQPNFMLTQNIYDTFQHASVFNFNAHLPTIDYNVNNMSEENLFGHIVFVTSPGDLNSSGIPPPLFSYNSHIDRMNYVEVDIELRKPIIINVREKSIERTIHDMLRLYMTLLESPCLPQRIERPVVRCSKLRQLQLQCMKANRLRLICNRVTLKFYEVNDYASKFICQDLSVNFKFRNHPEKASIKGSIGSFYILIDKKVILHPIVLRFSTDFLSEPWWDQPLVYTSLTINVFHLDLGILMLVQIRKARAGLNRMFEFIQNEWNYFLQRRPMLGPPKKMSEESLIQLVTPTLEKRKSKDANSNAAREEFYQDDLRAGAFQFVDMSTDSVLPMPYQIQIIKKNYGIICWRYPQPRRMVNINIFPVPMPVDNPIQIRCRMEYFSETHETFLHYCDFLLSEISTREVQLPERKICAYIWRVVIMQSLISVNGECFEPSEDDEELVSIASTKIDNDFKNESDNDFILHPKVLVGCMRIDTAFQTKYIPKFQVLLSCNSILVNLLNQPNAFVTLPIVLSKYNMKKTSMISQIFFSFELERLNVLCNVFEPASFNMDAGALGTIKCLDYGFLNMLEVLEPTNFQSFIEVKKRTNTVKANFLVDKLRFNFGPSVIHSVLSSKTHWEEVLSDAENFHTLIPKCVVINRCETQLAFGQTGTSEEILLNPMECHIYYFRSDYHNQELTFHIVGDNNGASSATESVHIPFKFESNMKYYNLKVGSKVLFIIMGKLSSTQIYVLVKGQIEIISKLNQQFYVEFRGINEEDGEGEENTAKEHAVSAKGLASWIYPVTRNSDISMRLKLSSGKGKGRTGDIPLKANNSLPWLVKIPMLPSQQFMSVWVRVLREDLQIDNPTEACPPQRLLIQIWPIFEVCNMLSHSVKCKESTTDETFTISGKGGKLKLRTPTTHLTEHKLTFDYGVELGRQSYNEYTLMLKAMDWHKFFHYDQDFLTIEKMFAILKEHNKTYWPLNDEEELRVQRNFNEENSFDVVYKCEATHPYSCTLGLKLLPWGTFINATSLNLSICTQDKHKRIPLPPNSLEMITALESIFTIDVEFGTNWVSSYPICLAELDIPSSHLSGRNILLYGNSYADIVILRNEEIIKFVLELIVENDRRIFKLRSKFVIANCTKVHLNVLPLALEHREKSTRDEVLIMKNEKRCNELSHALEVDDYCAGNSIDLFYDINARKAKRNPDTTYAFFVCFVIGKNTEISIPVPLQTAFTRRCFSLQDGQDSVPLAVTLVEKNNVFYLTLFRDTVPAMIISNHTNLKFIVAQTSASEHSNVTNTTPDYSGKHFEWHQLVCPHSKCYYTPPLLYINFPDVEFTFSNLSLALYSEDANARKKIAWSKPIRTDKTWKKFLRVPNHGDVKVTVCDKHRVIRVSIYYVSQQMEFLVKDLRSRLLQPQERNNSVFIDENIGSNSSLETDVHYQAEETVVLQAQNSECVHFRNECQVYKNFKLNFFVKKIVFSLQADNEDRDYMKTEVCNIYVDDLLLRYVSDTERNQVVLEIPNLQVDNQLYSSGKYDFPVLLCSEQLYRRTHCLPQIYTLDKGNPSVEEFPIFATITLDLYENENSLESVHCKFSPFRAYIEDSYINQLLEALLECEPSNCVYTRDKDNKLIRLPEGLTLLPESVVDLSRWIAEPFELRNFVVEPVNILLSVHTSLRLYIALDHSPLSFSRYERRQILTMPMRLGQSLGMHYLSGAIFGAGWVVGSLEILGSPSALARSFTTGLRDFISMPVHGLLRGPWGFVVGITQGSASLLRNITAGTVNSVTKLASSVARNLDRLTLDDEHIERTEALRRSRPQGFTDGLTQGMTGLGISILGAVGGLAHHTLEARDSVGVITGLTKGIVGAFTKPISGAAEMLALAGQGVLQTVGFNAMPLQVEPSVSRNAAVHPSCYRIWTILPVELNTDQILFYHPITLLVQDQLRPAYIFLTSAVLAIMEADHDKLTFLASVDLVEMLMDRDDHTKFYLHRSRNPASGNALEEQQSFTNQRIMKFLTTSHADIITVDSLNDILEPSQSSTMRHTDWIYYINEIKGEHLLHYLKVINKLK